MQEEKNIKTVLSPEGKAVELFRNVKGFRISNSHRKKTAKLIAEEVYSFANDCDMVLISGSTTPSSLKEYMKNVIKEIDAIK